MAIKYIINGYFRSGTTLLWKLISESLTSSKCFYEPLHPKLSEFIVNTSVNSIDDLHGFNLWNEYILLDEPIKKKLVEFHPNLTYQRFTWRELKQYFDIYDQFTSDVLLQTNRPHHHLEQIKETYNPQVIQILRRPYSVYSSIVKAYKSENKGLKGVIKKSLPFGFFEAFEIQREYDWIQFHFDKTNDKRQRALSVFDKFCYVYCFNNYAAINAVLSEGLIISYDRLIHQPQVYTEKLEQIFSLKKGCLPAHTIKPTRKDDQILVEQFEEKFEESVKSQGLIEHYGLIKQAL